jgi:hypothetical protein
MDSQQDSSALSPFYRQLKSGCNELENPDFFRLTDFIQFTPTDLPQLWLQSV